MAAAPQQIFFDNKYKENFCYNNLNVWDELTFLHNFLLFLLKTKKKTVKEIDFNLEVSKDDEQTFLLEGLC